MRMDETTQELEGQKVKSACLGSARFKGVKGEPMKEPKELSERKG